MFEGYINNTNKYPALHQLLKLVKLLGLYSQINILIKQSKMFGGVARTKHRIAWSLSTVKAKFLVFLHTSQAFTDIRLAGNVP
jgi:hypothetical protein